MPRKSQYYGESAFYEAFGSRFRWLREYLKLSQEQMAAKLDITRQRVSQIESGNGKFPIGIYLFYRVCVTFPGSVLFLLGLRQKKKSKSEGKSTARRPRTPM